MFFFLQSVDTVVQSKNKQVIVAKQMVVCFMDWVTQKKDIKNMSWSCPSGFIKHLFKTQLFLAEGFY